MSMRSCIYCWDCVKDYHLKAKDPETGLTIHLWCLPHGRLRWVKLALRRIAKAIRRLLPC